MSTARIPNADYMRTVSDVVAVIDDLRDKVRQQEATMAEDPNRERLIQLGAYLNSVAGTVSHVYGGEGG